MSKSLLTPFLFLVLLSACAPSSRNTDGKKNQADPIPVTSNNPVINPDSLIQGQTAISLFDLPQSQDGDIILSNGFYEADFKSYCLQPGTPAPSGADAYLQAPLRGNHRDIIESILRNSLDRPDLKQHNIQLLLWSVVSGSEYSKLAPSVKSTARELLTSKQIFALQGGVMGVVKTIATSFPDNGASNTYNDMRRLFELGNSSYEAYESIAVLRQPSIISHANYNRDQWYQQENGYYVRYFPNGYQRIKIQVYVPSGTVGEDGKKSGDYLLFDPVTMMAIPANSNAQRLGVGAPVVEVIRKVIEIQKTPKPVKKPPVSNPNPKGIVLK